MDDFSTSPQGGPFLPGSAVGDEKAMTLVEVLVATAIFGLVFGSVMTGLSRAIYRANWASCNIEANKLAEQRLEQMQNARWDLTASPTVDQVVSNNFPLVTTSLLDYKAGGSLIATNWVTINTLPNTNSPQYKILASSVRWSYRGRGPFTNTVTSIRAMDQ
jgi:prepilin-type N-terminal cleavage/methylation domain-containing protein